MYNTRPLFPVGVPNTSKILEGGTRVFAICSDGSISNIMPSWLRM